MTTFNPDDLNPKQKDAINFPYDRPAVVTAAAGSGKTTVLVERVVRLLSDKNSGIRAETLAILTFTRNAAKSLREKLNNRLNDSLSKQTDPEICEYLKEQIFELRQAYISTIDAFCLRIIRENPEAFDLPMNFTIADAPKLAAMQLRAINLAMQDFYNENLPADRGFSENERRDLFFSFDFEDDKGLREAVMSAANDLSTFADAEKWLSDAKDAYKDPASFDKHFMKTFVPRMKAYRSRAKKIIKGYDGLVDALNSEVKKIESDDPKKAKGAPFKTYKEVILPTVEDYIRFDLIRLEEFIKNCAVYEESPSLKTFFKAISDFKDHGNSPKVDGKSGTKTDVRKIFAAVKKLSENLEKDILDIDFDYDSTIASLPDQYSTISAFIKLVELYRGYYDLIKKTSGCLNFSDCELLLLKKLENAEFRTQLSNRFSCIIVDEFQDSNDIQAEIFKRLGNGRLFYVGDVKQSIYAFRGGNPEIMTRLCDGEDGFKALPLNQNHRSRMPIIETSNAAFSGLMTREYGGVDYEDPENRLVFGADKLPEIPEKYRSKYSCEICFANGSEGDEKDMPRIVAERIRALHDDPDFKITKHKQLVRPDYSDFVILFRNGKRIDAYRAALAELGISSASSKGQHFLESEEINLIINYLTIIDNPLRDEEMLKVMMSPIYRFTADEMSRIRLGLLGIDMDELSDDQKKGLAKVMKNYSLFNCVRSCSKPLKAGDFPKIFGEGNETEYPRKPNKKLEEFVRNIKRFRYFMGSSSIYKLVCKICDDTDLPAFCAVMDNSEQRVANVRRFQNMAAEFESRDGGSLSDFLRFIERVRSLKNNKVEDAAIPPDSANAVRLMTFHASKGLEVPICILAELDKPMSNNDYTGVTLMNRDYGLAMMNVDLKKRIKRATFAHYVMSKINYKRLCGEELRLLYVAMTRAQEKLIMFVGRSSDRWKKTADFDSLDDLFEGKTAFKWAFASLMKHYDQESEKFTDIDCTLSDISVGAKNDKTGAENTESTESADNNDQSPPEIPYTISDEEAEKLAVKISLEYKYEKDTHRREKYSVTELAHKNSPMPVVITKPHFAEDSEISGADKGNAYHNCMQYIPLGELQSAKPSEYREIIERAIQKMTEQRHLTAAEADIIDPALIADFFGGELGQRMFKSAAIRREQPFYAEVNGKDIGEDDLGEITLQGRIDLYFIESGKDGDSIVVVDYKSDNVFNLEKEKENYAKQVKIYSTVLPMLTGLPVKGIYLYAFLASEAIEIT